MPQRTAQRALRRGSRVRLHGHVWRVQSVTEVDAGPGRTLKESVAGYVVAAVAAASPGDVPWCVVVGGPNGAGKTTFALEYLPRYRALADRFLLLDNTGQAPVCVYQRCEEDEWIKEADRFARIRGEVGL